MKLKYFNKVNDNVYELILSGEIGWEFSGKEIANEIRYLNNNGATKIIERINSGGGSVIDAFDIVDANLNSKAVIETIVTGLAGSALGWVAATGTKGYRKIADYAMGMIHDPSMMGETIETTTDPKIKEALTKIKESIVTIFANMTGKTPEEVAQSMTNETWYNAASWVENGFADKVITTKRNNVELNHNTMSLTEMMNVCSNMAVENKLDKTVEIEEVNNVKLNFDKMKLINGYLKLNEASDEQSIINAIKEIEKNLGLVSTERDALTTENKTLVDNATALQLVIDGYKTKEKEANTAAVLSIVNEAVKVGKIRKTEVENFTSLFGEDAEKAEKTMNAITLPNGKIEVEADEDSTENLIPAERKDWTIRDWEKKDAEGLLNIKTKNFEVYKTMFVKFYEVEPVI